MCMQGRLQYKMGVHISSVFPSGTCLSCNKGRRVCDRAGGGGVKEPHMGPLMGGLLYHRTLFKTTYNAQYHIISVFAISSTSQIFKFLVDINQNY